MTSRLFAAVFCGVALALTGVLAPYAEANGLLAANRPEAPQRSARDAVVLQSHRVQVVVRDRVASVTVRQVFLNRTAHQLEGVYLFPLPEGASVSEFAMTMGDRLVKGEIVEAKRARAIYEGIVRRRRDPGLLELVGRGLFRAKVFPIPARGDVTIELAFQQLLAEDAGTLELRYPLASDRFHAAPVEDVVVDVKIESTVDIRSIFSPSHDLEIARDGSRRVRVSYEGSGRRQQRDLLLYVGRSVEDVAFSALSHKPQGAPGTFLAVFAPPAAAKDADLPPKDVVYVLDTSGSMRANEKLDQARRALQFGIGVLRPQDRFNVISFASAVRPYRDELVSASPETKRGAQTWVGELSAQGATDIGLALTKALSWGRADRLLLVVLITDGRPTVGIRNHATLLERVKQRNRVGARICTFGVGYDLDVPLLDRIAEAAGGTRDYVEPGQDLEIVTSRFFTKVNHPVLTELELDAGGGITDVYPRKLGDLFLGQQLVVIGRFREAGPRRFVLSARRGAARVTRTYDVTLRDTEDAAYLPRLWASRKIAYLVDDLRLHGERKELVDEVVALATRYSIVTPYTSGLVVEDAELERPVARGPAMPPRTGHVGGWSGGGGGRYRGPGGAVPPGLREPSDPTPAPPPPPSGPPTTPSIPTTPSTPTTGPMTPTPPGPTMPTAGKRAVEISKDLARRKAREAGTQGDLEHAKVRAVAGKTFVLRAGVWTDAAYKPDVHAKLRKVEAFSDVWLELSRTDVKLAKYLSVGESVIVVWKGEAISVHPRTDQDD